MSESSNKRRYNLTKSHRTQYERNKVRLFKTETVCGICGQPIDFSLKFPEPMSAVVDHIIPVAKGGHPSDISNLQLAHNVCNEIKGDKLFRREPTQAETNRVLPWRVDWLNYRDGLPTPGTARKKRQQS